MLSTLIRAEPEDVDARLAAFGLTRASFYPVLHAVTAARADVVAADAAVAGGTKAWLAGVRHLNLMMLPLGWTPGRNDGVEEIRDPDSSTSFVYQNVDQACSPIRGPRAVSGKGPASDRMIEEAQGWLLRDYAPEASKASDRKNEAVWFLCVSVNDEETCAELSLPTSLEGNNFKTFAERIFIVKPGEWASVEFAATPMDDRSAADDYEFNITKK